MTSDELHELKQLDAAERSGQVLTGAERGRLADLRRAEILAAVAGLFPPINPITAGMEVR